MDQKGGGTRIPRRRPRRGGAPPGTGALPPGASGPPIWPTFIVFGAIRWYFGFSASFGLQKNIPGTVLRSSFHCGRFEWHIDILPDNFTVTAFRTSVPILSRKIEYSQFDLEQSKKGFLPMSNGINLSTSEC